jgi:hypothetical protein
MTDHSKHICNSHKLTRNPKIAKELAVRVCKRVNEIFKNAPRATETMTRTTITDNLIG